MASGKFTSRDKIRPGAYFNFQSGKKTTGVNASGIIAMTAPLDWGTPNTFVEITSQTNLVAATGRDVEESKMLLVREALKTAQKVLLFNVAGITSSKSNAQINADLTIEAVKFGVLGNEIKVVIDELLDGTFTVSTYFRNSLVDTQNISSTDAFKSNDYIEITGAGDLEEVAGVILSGASTEAPTNDNYVEYLKALELKDFYAFCIDTADATIKQTAINYTKKWRDAEGKKVVFISAEVAADYEGVVNVGNGVELANGVKLTALQCTPYIAGEMASAGITKSLTYHIYEGAVDANPRMLQSDIEDALRKGELIFTRNQNNVVVEQDINSLTTVTDIKNTYFKKNKIIRIIDTLNTELLKVYSNSFIGQISNDEDGRELLKKDILVLLDEFKDNNALNDYESEDVEVIAGQDKDVVIVNMAISVADAMEKMYVTVTLN